jgi:hypothetical protein
MTYRHLAWHTLENNNEFPDTAGWADATTTTACGVCGGDERGVLGAGGKGLLGLEALA